MSRSFHFEFVGDYSLTVEEIWPDGDAPENPTTEQVIERVRESCFDARSLIRDWNLDAAVLIDGKPVWP